MLLKKSVLFTATLLAAMAILLAVNVITEQKGAEAATPCVKPVPKCCIKKTTEEFNPQQPVTNFILQI
jgi:hypothetical protein